MTTTQKTSKTLNSLLWTAQILLAAGFFWAAFMKICQPADELAEMWPWTAENPELVKITGVLDLLAGMGLILPGILKMSTRIITLAAFGTIALMIAAIVFHVSRGEGSQIGINIFYILLAGFVAWGRSNS